MNDKHMEALFRSPGLKIGDCRALENVHLHIDLHGSEHLVNAITAMSQDLEKRGIQSKIQEVDFSVSGSHCLSEEFRDTYALHTPGTSDLKMGEINSCFGYFSTHSLGRCKNSDAATRLRFFELLELVCGALAKSPESTGIVFEMERVCAVIDQGGVISKAEPFVIDNIEYKNERLTGDEGAIGFEIHHAVNFSEDTISSARKLDFLRELSRISDAAGVPVGGWFLFHKKNSVEYRSVRFTKEKEAEHIALESHEAIFNGLRHLGLEPLAYWTIVEQILGIWKVA